MGDLAKLVSENIAPIIAYLGGGSAIAFAVSAYSARLFAKRAIEKQKSELQAELERLKSELARESDLHKLKIRRAELLFDRELDAVSAFSTIHKSTMPSYSHPDMDWHDACEEVGGNLDSIERTMSNYLTKHGHILPRYIRDKVRSCVTIASHNKFSEYDMPGPQGEHAKVAAGENLIDAINDIEEDMHRLVQNEVRSAELNT